MDFSNKIRQSPLWRLTFGQEVSKTGFRLCCYIAKMWMSSMKRMTAIFGILAKAEPLEAALKNGPVNLERTVENIARTLQLCLVTKN